MASRKERLRNLIVDTMKHKSFKKNTKSHSRSRNTSSGAVRLSQDMAILVNNPQGSDVQFKVGGSGTLTIQESGGDIYDEPAVVTLYAHSVILCCRSRYFAAMFDEERSWKESSKGVIHKPNISPNAFEDVLFYIYTGSLRAKNSKNMIEIIAAADEMGLEELSIECQARLIRTVERIFSDEDDSNDEYESDSGRKFGGLIKQRASINVAIQTHIIPALNLASKHSLSHFSNKLITIILPHMSLIAKSPETYTTFINKISLDILAKIIESDNLAMTERSVWDLVLSWACHQSNLSKTAVETYLSNPDDKEKDYGDETAISASQLNELKTILVPLLPSIRFSLLAPNDYTDIFNILHFFLSRRRLSELNQYFISTNRRQLDTPRMESLKQKPPSKIIVEFTMWELLKKNIFETGGINGCPSLSHMKVKLLFRASKHGFLSSIFHQRCDNKGPSLVLVRSSDGHLFGGVNFNSWKSDNSYSSSLLNFLFALPDGHHRNSLAIFRTSHVDFTSYNYIGCGPTFGAGYDLYISDSANINQYSHSYLPYSYHGEGASVSALAGANQFIVSDYEVFSIAK